MFQLPFIEFILYTLVNLFFFFLIVQIAAYSVFYMYRVSRTAQIYLTKTFGFLGLLLSGILYFVCYYTLFIIKVNIFKINIVNGLIFMYIISVFLASVAIFSA